MGVPAEMARQRQEIARYQADLTREIEVAARDSGLRERLHSLRRGSDVAAQTPEPTPTSAAPTSGLPERKSSGLFRRIFG